MIQDQIKELLHISMWNVLRARYKKLDDKEKEEFVESLEKVFKEH